MPIERITADDLRDMEHQEGLVLQGCGGEAQELSLIHISEPTRH